MATMRTPRVATVLSLTVLALLVPGCGGSDDNRDGEEQALTVWILESEPDRLRATRANVARFAKARGFKVTLAGIGDDELAQRMSAAAQADRLPDVVQLPMASAHRYARHGILSTDAAQDVVDRLGEDTFSARALSLLTSEGRVTAVPSDGWGQLLIYRKDLFDEAGLGAPRSLDDVRRAARRLHGDGIAGITLATAPSPFTAETFEHVALAAGCQLLNERGNVTLTSPQCQSAFNFYIDLARNYSVEGSQDVDSTRDTYFSGQAAMIFWSPFLLDAMAGLRDDAVPSCPQCEADPAYLARNSGLVGPLAGRTGEPAQFGNVSTWGITADANLDGAEQFVAYMMSEGYVRWLALSPQGKYPVRFGDRAEPDRYVNGWAGLESGVERKAPLTRFYAEKSIESLGDGARNFQRWGFEEGGAALVGAMRESEPVASALASAISGGGSGAGTAREAQAAVERLAAALD
jgi:ABC-type glycerol-3-phosphate transport system substrate-binding protein